MIKEKIYYTSPIFKNITHGFFSKKGGVSKGIYNSLNCGKSSLDLENNVITKLDDRFEETNILYGNGDVSKTNMV